MLVKIWRYAKFSLTLHPQSLDDGVMVTLQVLVLSFPVRIRVVQHFPTTLRKPLQAIFT